MCVCFFRMVYKRNKQQRRHPHVVRDLQAHVALSGCELMSSCLPPTLDASEGSGIADQIRQVVKYTWWTVNVVDEQLMFVDKMLTMKHRDVQQFASLRSRIGDTFVSQ